ncbi:CgeB family protein [Vibrio crassostreae]|uniref:CgeB family protein n=1 Tax=Vibrio crassostreae TaxID=246167 RepID=UPI001B305095|nr:glycosyltransferase [Vibrio crassostreae]
MKVLIVGDFRFAYYEQELFNHLERDSRFDVVDSFKVGHYFSYYSYAGFFSKIFYSIQNRHKIGPVVNKLNRDLISTVENNTYDWVFIWRGIHFTEKTINIIKQKTVVFGYNNDDTFSKSHPGWLFKNLKKSIFSYDHFFFYRQRELNEYNGKGSLFLPTVDTVRIHPINNKKKYDIIFIGHFEPDGRDILILNLFRNENIKLGLFGQGWSKSQYYEEIKEHFGDIKPVYDDYNETLNSSKVALCLLSSWNGDKYTRRTIEIPAAGVAMLAQYTDEQAGFFLPNKEALYFNSYEDALKLAIYMIDDDLYREKLARSGYDKFMKSNFTMEHRIDEIIKIAKEINMDRNCS